jgi:hypothetical protein
VDLASLGAFATNIVPGFEKGQEQEANVTLRQEAAKQAKLQTEDLSADIASNISYANSLAALGSALNPQQPQPPPPGQQSQPAPQPAPPQMPTTSTGAPIVPPGGQVGQPAPPQAQAPQPQPMPPSNGPPPSQAQPPQQPPPQQAAPPRPQPPPQAQGQPPVGLARPPGPPQQPGQQPGGQPPPNPQELAQKSQAAAQMVEQKTAQATQGAQGQMSAQQLVALVNKANPGLVQKNPAAFVKTVEKLQRFLSADGKQELQAQKISMDFDAKIQKVQQEAQKAQMQATSTLEKTQIMAQAKLDQAQLMTQNALLLQQMKGGQQSDLQDKKGAQKDEQLDKTLASKADIEKFKATAKEKLAAGKDLTDDEVNKIAEVRSHGDASVMQLGMSQGQRGRVLALATDLAKQRGTTLNSEDAAYGGTKAAATTVGRTEGGVALGAAELKQLMPQVLEAAKKVNVGQFPTVNAFSQYAQRHKGEPEITTLDNFVQNVKNAYQQVAARGGRLSDAQRKDQKELMEGTMSMPQLIASGQSMLREAAIVKSSAGQAMKDVTGEGDAAPAGGGEGVDTSNPLLK